MSNLKIFSGECCLCDVGIPIKSHDCVGRGLFTGDIVLVYHGDYIGTDDEQWNPSGGLTVIVGNQYQSFVGGSVKYLTDDFESYVMGISNCGFDHPEWQIRKVKSFEDVVEGEHWKEFGFSYQYSEVAEQAKKAPGDE